MSTRSLYALFERQLGESPRQYIRRLRLERIRACLEDPGCRVRNLTELALDFGFAHLGRFAEQYRRQFGELPSETLRRRAWRRAATACRNRPAIRRQRISPAARYLT